MADAATGYVDILPRTDKFSSALSREIDPKLQAAGSNASNLAGRASTAFAALGVVAVGAIGKGISATQQWAGEVKTLQRVTGQSAEDASRLATVGQELGLSTTTLSQGFGLLAKNIVNGSSNLSKYGIATKDAEGNTLPFNDILGNISDKFVSLPKGIEQAAFAQNVFGRGGKALIPILSQGAAGLAELESQADKYGTTLSQKDLDASRELGIAQRQLGLAFKGASISIGRDFLPVLTSIVNGVTKVVEVIHLIPQPVLTATVGFVALAGGAAALGKGVGFLKSGWSELGNTFAFTTKIQDFATKALGENTLATVTNAEAQSTLEVAANAATNTLSTTSDVIDTGTKAVEGSTVAVVQDTAAQTAREAVAKAGIGTTTAQIAGQRTLFDATILGTGAVGDAAAAQTALFDATTLATGALERETLVAKGGGAAGLAGGTASRFAGGFAVAKVGLLELAIGLAGAKSGIGGLLQGTDDLANEFKVTADEAGKIKGHVDAIGATSLLHRFADPFGQAGANAAEATKAFGEFASTATEAGLSQEQINAALDAALPKLTQNRASIGDFTDALNSNLSTTAKANAAHIRLTKSLILERHPIDDLVSGSTALNGVFDLMGTSAGQFEHDATKAFRESDKSFETWARDFKSQAVDAWQGFRDQAKSALDFTGSMLSELEQTVAEASQKLAGDTKGLTSSQLSSLRSDAKLTATDILHTFQDAKKQTQSFGRDLLEISHRGGKAAKELASSLLASGDILAAQVIADAPKKLQGQIVSAFGAGQTAAENFATKLTGAIVGPLHDIRDVLIAIAKHWNIDVSFLDHGASDRLRTLNTQIDAIAGAHTFSFIQEGQPFVPPKNPPPKPPGLGEAAGGIFAASTGVAIRPTVLFGEGTAATPLGRGAEALLPIEKIEPIVANAMRRSGRDMHIHVTVGFDDSGNLQVRKIARDEIDREHDYRARVG